MCDNPIDVLILSAGKGTRTKNAFPNTPKALIDYNGTTALDIVLSPFKRHVDQFKISLNVRQDEVDYFKNLGYDLFIEDIPIGNAGAIKKFGANLSDPFIVSHNDISLPHLSPIKLVMEHLQNDSFLTMTIKNVGQDKERGIVVRKHNKVLGFTRERMINCGMYCISHKTFECIDEGFQDIDNHLLTRLSSIHQLSCYEYDGFYEDWGK